MPETKLKINNKVGLHARPAALFVKTASKYKSTITVKNGDCEANAKSIINILTLGVEQGTIIDVIAEGEDAQQALDGLTELVDDNFGEKG